jgi:uncharacterized membrane protein
MLTYAVIVFAIGALGGLILSTFVLRGRFAPWALSLLHGALGVTGFVLVVISALRNPLSGPLIFAVVLLVVTALTGLYLASRHYRSMLTPRALVATHAGFALSFLLILSGAVFGII